MSGSELEVYGRDGKRFLSSSELTVELAKVKAEAKADRKQLRQLLAKLRAQGIDPEKL
jgi:hypothetical protein